MSATRLVTVDEYLSTCYRPDCDYVEGLLVERNAGEKDHSKLQLRLASWLEAKEDDLGICVFPEQRIQVSSNRFRVPDLCVVAGSEPAEQIFIRPPHICIEILSKDDSLADMQERIDDYAAFGVPYIWLIDPRRRRAWEWIACGLREAKDLVLRAEAPAVVVPLAEVFARVDRRSKLT